MTGAELLAAIAAAPERRVRQSLLDRLVKDHAGRPDFPVILRKLKTPQRLYAAARALENVPDQPELVEPILAAVTRGLGRSRSLQRLIELQSRVLKCNVLDEAVREAEERTRLACPKCDAKLPRPTLIRHLWFKHRLVFEKGRARDPAPLFEEQLRQAISSEEPDATDHVFALAAVSFPGVEPVQIHQALTARVEADPEELEPLQARARERHAGLCPRCLAPVPGVAPLPPPLIVSHGRLAGEGFVQDLGPVGASRKRAVKWSLVLAILGLFVVLFLPSSLLSPIIVFIMVASLAGALYVILRAREEREPARDDAVVDAAWRDLVPRVGRSAPAVRFLTRLCRTSLEHGSTISRTEAVWSQVEQAAILSGKGTAHLQWFAAVRVLQAYDAGKIGQDWIPSLVGLFAPVFRGEASLAYAEAVAETLIESHDLSDKDGARLRVLLAADAFAAGLSPADLDLIVRVGPQLGRLFAGDEAWFRALHKIWRERHRIAESSQTVFHYAANPAAGRTLAAFPDTLLIDRLDEPADRELGPVLIGRRGVTVADYSVGEANSEIAIEAGGDGSVLKFGPHTIPTRRKLPRKTAAILTDWLQYRDEFLATDKPSQCTEKLTAILAPIVADCPLCRQRCLVRIGELSLAWPLESDGQP